MNYDWKAVDSENPGIDKSPEIGRTPVAFSIVVFPASINGQVLFAKLYYDEIAFFTTEVPIVTGISPEKMYRLITYWESGGEL